MVLGETCTLSLCVYSAELDSAAHGAYCKVYIDANDRTNGSGGAGGGASSSDATSPDTSRSSDASTGARSFHTHVEKSEKKTYLPTWNETFTIDVFDRRHELLTIRLKSKKLLHVAVVGACVIPLSEIPLGRSVDKWFPVQKGGKRRGKLRLQMMVTYPQPPVAGVGPPATGSLMVQSPPPHGRTNSQNFRQSKDHHSVDSSAPLHRRPSQSVEHNNQLLEGDQRPPMTLAMAHNGGLQQQQATLASKGYESEDEPHKEHSPLKKETYELYRPATNPRLLDSESDDDDEALFPRVAELHRLESDLIGESSDEEVETYALAPKSPMYLERLIEDQGEEHSASFSANASAAVDQTLRDSLTLDDFKPHNISNVKPPIDGRASVEIVRRTKVSKPEDDLEKLILELSATTASSGDDVEEGIDMTGVVTGVPVSHGDVHNNDVAIGEVVVAEAAEDVWNRYSSSSSEDLELPYPDEDLEASPSAGSRVYEGIPVAIHDATLYGKAASPHHSNQDDEVVDDGHHEPPRDSIASNGNNQNEVIEDDHDSPTEKPFSPEVSSKNAAASDLHNDSSPRNSWVSERTTADRDGSSPRSSWISESGETVTTRMTGRDKSYSGTSWVSEHDAHKEASRRSSWISEHSVAHDATAMSPRRSGRDKSWSGTSWISEQDSASVVAASTTHEQGSHCHSGISDKSEADSPTLPARLTGRDKSWSGTSWVNESDSTSFVDATGPRSSWVSEEGEVDTKDTASPRHSWVSDAVSESPARLTGRDKSWSGTSWVNESDSTSFVDATGPRSSWVSEEGEVDTKDAASPRHSWVSDAVSESPARLTGRDKSWSGTSWVSDNERSSFVDESGPPRSSWISESDDKDVNPDSFDAVEDTTARTSWIHEDGAPPPARLTSRDKSWSGTSWVSETDNTSFIDATGLRSSWIGEDADADAVKDGLAASPRHSWVSEAATEPSARRTGREKSYSGTSWVSEEDHNEQMTLEQSGSPRSSWVSENGDHSAGNAAASRHSWVSDAVSESPARLTGRDKSWSGTSWVSDNERSSFVDDSGTPRSSWVSESEDKDVNPDSFDAVEASSARTSWIQEDGAPPPARLTGRDKSWSGTSWVSENENTSFIDATGLRSSWIGEDVDVDAVTDESASSLRHSWVSESATKSSARKTGREKSWSGTSWVSEQDDREQTAHEQSGSPRSSWVSEDGAKADDEAEVSRHSWVSDAVSETPARLTGRDKSWSGTSWVSDNERSSFVDESGPPRSSWISESDDKDVNPDSFDAVEDTTARTSWIHEDGAPPPARLTGRDKSWSGTSWVSETDNTSFIDATGLRSSWIGEDADADAVKDGLAASPRHSWVSEAATEPSARRTGREKSYSGTSWISEDADHGGADDVEVSRHSWVSEKVADAPARRIGRDKSWSGTSWVSEQENTSFGGAGSPRSSWVSETDSAAPDARMTGSPRHSWVSERGDASTAVRGSSTSWVSENVESRRSSPPRSSWISEDVDHATTAHNEEELDDSQRSSWVDEDSHAASLRRHLSSSQTSWVNEATNSHSFVNSSFTRHSFASEGSAGEEEDAEPATKDAGVAILPAPARDSVDASTPPRVSLLSEISDIIEGEEHGVSPRSSISADHTSEPTSQTDTFVSERISSVSSVEIPDHHHQLLVTNTESPRGSDIRNEDKSPAWVDESASIPHGSVSSKRLSMEDDAASAPRVSFVSEDGRTTETSVDIDIDGLTLPPATTLAVVADTSLNGHLDSAPTMAQPQSDEEGMSDYDDDNLETSMTRSSSLISEHARNHDLDVGNRDPEARHSSSSSNSGSAYRTSSYPDSYTNLTRLTRHSSMSSVGKETVVDRDNAERHAEAVAEAARYSSSSEEFEDLVDHTPSALNVVVHAVRRYSSASEEDTVDRSSYVVGSDYDGLSAGRSHSSSSAARDEAQFTAWTEESSTYGDFSDAMRRDSQLSSDVYDASPRASDDLGVLPELHPLTTSAALPSSAASLEIADPPTLDLRRFISSVDVFNELYEDDEEDETSRSYMSLNVVPSTHKSLVPPTSTSPVEEVKVTVIMGETKPTPVNPFVEYGSSRSSASSDEAFPLTEMDETDVDAEMLAMSRQSSQSSQGDHEVVVVETLDQLVGPTTPAMAVVPEGVETKASPVASITSERSSVTAAHEHLDNLFVIPVTDVDGGNASSRLSLSSASPIDRAVENTVVASELLDRASQECDSEETKATLVSASDTTFESVLIETSNKPPAPSVAAPSASVSASASASVPARKATFSDEEESKSEAHSTAMPSVFSNRQNLRGDHVLVSMASSLTRAQLQAVAQDYLPSDDSENESDDYDSDYFNFDSDTDE